MEIMPQHVPEFTVTAAEFVAFSVYTAKDSRFHRRRFRLTLLVVALALFGMFAGTFAGGIDWASGWDPLAIILLVAFPLIFMAAFVALGWFELVPLTPRIQGRARFRGKGYEMMRAPLRFAVTQAGLHVQGTSFDSVAYWPSIIEAVLVPIALYLYSSPIQISTPARSKASSCRSAPFRTPLPSTPSSLSCRNAARALSRVSPAANSPSCAGTDWACGRWRG
jgi:hypothetical protein